MTSPTTQEFVHSAVPSASAAEVKRAPVESTVEAPGAIGSPQAAFDVAERYIRTLRPTSVLDCPAGKGAFTARLLKAGCDVTACDILPHQFALHEQCTCHFADMNDSLPLEADTFDCVACLNGIHRIWARGRTLAEFYRVLKPGGTLVLTNVNNSNLMRRALYATVGSTNFHTVGPPHAFFPNTDVPAAWYRAPYTVADICSVAMSAGFAIKALQPVSMSKASILLAPLALPAVIVPPLLPQRYRKHVLPGLANSMAAMFADYLMIVMTKPDSGANGQ